MIAVIKKNNIYQLANAYKLSAANANYSYI